MPIPDDIVTYWDNKGKCDDRGKFIDDKYELTHKVMKLQKDYVFVQERLDCLLATLRIEHNRRNLRKGEGLEQLFEIVDNVAETIEKWRAEE